MCSLLKNLSKGLLLAAAVLMLNCVSAFAQNVKVTGKVTDQEGLPVVAAAVFQQGATQNGTVTDNNGVYTITVPSNATLVFSSLGYKDTAVAVNGKASINVVLETSAEYLEDVVVTAQGLTRKQKAIGYSAQKIGGEELTLTRVGDIGNSLAGKVAGAMFWGKSGATFDTGSIVLRGTTSYGSATGSAPIYVVDGAITAANAINMDDIESINILKGPSATALYGSRGANGAVIVTTMKGAESGKGRIDFSHTTTANVYKKEIELNTLYGGGSTAADVDYEGYAYGAGAHDYTSAAYLLGELYGMKVDGGYYLDYYSDENWGPRFDPNVKVASALYWDPTSTKYKTLDAWQAALDLRDVTQIGWNNTTNIAFSKAGSDYNTRISFTNTDMKGVMLNSDAQRRFLSLSSQFSPKKWFTTSLNYKFTNRKNHNAAREGYSATANVICEFTQWGQTNVNLKDYKDWERANGTWRTWNPVSTSNLTANFHDNPYATLERYNSYSTSNYHVVSGDAHFNLPYNIKAGYRLNGYVQANLSTTKNNTVGSMSDTDSYYGQTQSQYTDFTHQVYASYSDAFVDNRLTVEADVFAEQRQYDAESLSSNTNNGLNNKGYFNLAGSNNTYTTSNSESHYITRSFFGTSTIGWNDTYFIDFSLRNDIDSRLGQGNNSYLYGGGSLSVMLSNFINASWLDFWKLRGSVAQVGSTVGAYNIYPTYSMGTKWGSVNTMTEPAGLKNPDIRPTISTSYEIGTEFKMFKNRLHGDINLYRKNTRNQIIDANTLAQSGYSSRKINAGMVRNEGIEIMIGGSPIKTKDVQWDMNFNIAKNVNTLVELAPDMNQVTIYWTKFQDAFGLRSIEGEPIGVIYSGSRWAKDENGNTIYKKLATPNGAWGEIQPVLDRTEKNIGNVQPDFTGGFNTNFRYKNLTFGASLDYMIGGQFFSWTNMWGAGSGTLASTAQINNRGVNVREAVVDGGGVYCEGVDASGNPVSGYMSAYNYYHYQANYNNDGWLYDRTYVKLRELSVGYQIPKKWIQGTEISRASVAFVANNPWLIYRKCPNVDPSEIGGASYGYLEGGQAVSTRSYGLTVNISF